MSDGSSLINLGEISKPATVLIEKISDAVGGIAKPWQIERVAKAEAKAEVARAEGRIQISEIEERALQRMVHEEGKRQENIENITAKAIPYLTVDAKPEEVEDDWLTHFFDRCRLVSDEEMQFLWSRMLSSQANNPGSFSKNTLNIVSVFDKSDAEIFTVFCSFVWILEDEATPMVLDYEDKIINGGGIDFDSLTHLDDIGLITFDGINGFLRNELPKLIPAFYHGRSVVIEFQSEENSLGFGQAMLTRTGKELVKICNSRPNEDHYEHIISGWVEEGYALSCPIDTKPMHPPS